MTTYREIDPRVYAARDRESSVYAYSTERRSQTSGASYAREELARYRTEKEESWT